MKQQTYRTTTLCTRLGSRSTRSKRLPVWRLRDLAFFEKIFGTSSLEVKIFLHQKPFQIPTSRLLPSRGTRVVFPTRPSKLRIPAIIETSTSSPTNPRSNVSNKNLCFIRISNTTLAYRNLAPLPIVCCLLLFCFLFCCNVYYILPQMGVRKLPVQTHTLGSGRFHDLCATSQITFLLSFPHTVVQVSMNMNEKKKGLVPKPCIKHTIRSHDLITRRGEARRGHPESLR